MKRMGSGVNGRPSRGVLVSKVGEDLRTCGVDLVSGLSADDLEEVDGLGTGEEALGGHGEAEGFEGFTDVGGSLELLVELAAVAGDGNEGGVQGVVDGVVDVEGLRLDVGEVVAVEVLSGVGEACACFDCAPAGWVVEAQVPGPCPAHRKAAEDDPACRRPDRCV